MNNAVKNMLVTLLLVVLSPVTFALCPCLVKTSKAENSVTCCCKKKPVPAERKCPSQKELIRLQTLEKQRIQEPAPCPVAPVVCHPAVTLHPDEWRRFTRKNPLEASDCSPVIVQPPTLFLHHCSFII